MASLGIFLCWARADFRSTGLIGHLKTHFPLMYRLYSVLKSRSTPPTAEEEALASGQKILDPGKATEYLVQLEKASNNVIAAFQQQAQNNMVNCLTSRIPHLLNPLFAG
jgi:hypothetical protein